MKEKRLVSDEFYTQLLSLQKQYYLDLSVSFNCLASDARDSLSRQIYQALSHSYFECAVRLTRKEIKL